MPSLLLGFLSGGTNILSGNYFSGQGGQKPVGSLQMRIDKTCSGFVYVGLSGGVTIQSGGFPASGAAAMLLDGMQLGAGDAYLIPRIGFGPSGANQVYCHPDANCSGQARVYWEPY